LVGTGGGGEFEKEKEGEKGRETVVGFEERVLGG